MDLLGDVSWREECYFGASNDALPEAKIPAQL